MTDTAEIPAAELADAEIPADTPTTSTPTTPPPFDPRLIAHKAWRLHIVDPRTGRNRIIGRYGPTYYEPDHQTGYWEQVDLDARYRPKVAAVGEAMGWTMTTERLDAAFYYFAAIINRSRSEQEPTVNAEQCCVPDDPTDPPRNWATRPIPGEPRTMAQTFLRQYAFEPGVGRVYVVAMGMFRRWDQTTGTWTTMYAPDGAHTLIRTEMQDWATEYGVTPENGVAGLVIGMLGWPGTAWPDNPRQVAEYDTAQTVDNVRAIERSVKSRIRPPADTGYDVR